MKLARNLLREDGVIFVSIDDREIHNLRKLADEIFGGDAFLGCISIQSNARGRQSEKIATSHEYLLAYGRNSEASKIYGESLTDDEQDEYKFDDPEKGRYRLLGLRHRGNASFRSDRPNMFFPFYVDPSAGTVALQPDSKHTEEVFPIKSTGEDGRWEWGRETALVRLGLLQGRKVGTSERWDIFHKDFLESDDGEIHRKKWKTIWAESSINYQNGKTELKEIFGGRPLLEYPKPLALLKKIVAGAADRNDIILDFFSGSATTAHAVMQLNTEDGANRRHILVQLPEPCDENSEAYKAGYATIAEIGKERIRRAGAKIRAELTAKLAATKEGSEEHQTLSDRLDRLDTGFRVLKIADSNFAEIHREPDQLNQGDLLLHVENIKPDRGSEDLLFQVLLDWGVDLALPVTEETIEGRRVFFVDDDALAASFETDLGEAFIKALAKRTPLRAVFRDSGYASDAVKINIEQIFKALSPHTELKTV